MKYQGRIKKYNINGNSLQGTSEIERSPDFQEQLLRNLGSVKKKVVVSGKKMSKLSMLLNQS